MCIRDRRKGEETVFLFAHDVVASVARPLLELKGFARIALKPGARGVVRFTLSADDFVFPDAGMNLVFEPGDVEILAGPSADPSRLGKTTLRLADATKRGRTARRRYE